MVSSSVQTISNKLTSTLAIVSTYKTKSSQDKYGDRDNSRVVMEGTGLQLDKVSAMITKVLVIYSS